MGRHFPHIGKFLDVCTFALKKTIWQSQTPTLFGFHSGGETLSFPHAHLVLCVYRVCVCALLCSTVCFVHRKYHPCIYENTGFVVTPLKKLESLSRQKQSVEAHKHSCGHATDGSLFIQPRLLNWRLHCRFLKHFCFPRPEAPSTTSPVTLSICPSQELRGTLPRESCWVTQSCNCLLKQETDKPL